MSLKEIYLLYSKKQESLKVRFKFWDHHIKYFRVKKYDKEKNIFYGELDSGESISYQGDILDWHVYYTEEDFYTRLVS